ncbi:MAG: indole-3-glycerol phosphate synthase TrpC [Hyphomonadaceae bacterium]|nr:indole-3-glycerol phosphate synthase TrpC [Hyphomonadaceae bacterium]
MSDTLSRILDYKRADVAQRKAARPSLDAAARAAAPPRGFRAALETVSRTRYALIAEIKKASPSKGLIRADFDPPTLARAYEAGGAACLSVLTDVPSFQGDDAYLAAARAACALPCLRKDFLVDPWQVAECRALGADAILIIMAACDDALARDLLSAAAHYGMDALVECHDAEELARAVALGATLIGVNNRDLRSFETRLETTEALAPLVPARALLVTESGLFTHDDLARMARAGARAFLVGEALMRQQDVAAATKILLTGETSA